MARYINAEQMKGDIKIAMANQQSKDPFNLLPTHLAELLCKFVDDTPTADVAPRSEVDNLECKLTGVMHFVDKWLDGDELEQDEVNRAITMREKTLQIVEGLKTDVERLTAEKETLELCVKDLRFRNKELQKANECLAKNCDDLELQVEEAIEFRRNQVKRIFEEFGKLCCTNAEDYDIFLKLKNKYT